MNIAKTMGAAALAFAMLPGSALAKNGGLCFARAFHPQAQLSCDHIGQVTMPEIYAKGWRVAAVWTFQVGGNVITYMAIEEQ